MKMSKLSSQFFSIPAIILIVLLSKLQQDTQEVLLTNN